MRSRGCTKWELEKDQAAISLNVQKRYSFAFSCVRNPYGRVLSCFLDKICAIQRDGRRYRHGKTTQLIYNYGFDRR